VNTRVCLRCDWSGETTEASCPTCGAPLYSSTPRQPVPHAPASAPPSPTGRTPEPPGQDEEPPAGPASSSRRSRIITACVVLGALTLAVVVFSRLQRSTPSEPRSAPHLTGTLVYAANDGYGSTRLWNWDLARNVVTPGPHVRDTVALVNASGAQRGWVGVTSRVRGRVVGSVLRSLDPKARATPLVSGDLVSWAQHGDSVVSLRRGSPTGCHRHITIVARELVPSVRDVEVDRSFCGDVLSLGRGAASTFFTIRRAGSTDIVFAGYRTLHLVLARHTLVGVSGVSDLLVMPAAGFASITEGEATAAPGTSLFFNGLDAPIRYGIGAERMRVDRILAWTPDSRTALVQGSLGATSGLFELDAGPGEGLRAPRSVGSVPNVVGATFTDDGTAILDTPEGFRTLSPGGLRDLPLPPSAPSPVGPLVWIG
jgi:hypothetical protein